MSYFNEENLTAEQFQRLSSSERFALKAKWSAEALEIGLSGGNDSEYYKIKINKYERPLERTIIRLFYNGKMVGEFETESEVAQSGLNITAKEVKYLLRYKNKNAKIFTVSKVKQRLVDNDYIEVEG